MFLKTSEIFFIVLNLTGSSTRVGPLYASGLPEFKTHPVSSRSSARMGTPVLEPDVTMALICGSFVMQLRTMVEVLAISNSGFISKDILLISTLQIRTVRLKYRV